MGHDVEEQAAAREDTYRKSSQVCLENVESSPSIEISKVGYQAMSNTFIVKVASKTIRFNLYDLCPLPADHLLSLIRYNLYRGVAVNSWIIGVDPKLMHSDILSPLTNGETSKSDFYQSLPPALQPTALQQRIPHHPYIDLFPFPPLRDALLTPTEAIDEDLLCSDFAGDTIDTGLDEHTGLIVWGEPWDSRSWEVTEPLARKWWWLLKRCPEALEATNYWRQRRGEPRLVEIT